MKTTAFRKAIFTAFLIQFGILHSKAGIALSVTQNPAIVGCPDTFTYNIAATDYQWSFGNDATPATVGGAGYQTAGTIFAHPGPHKVIVSAMTSGGWITDSMTITVNPTPLVITLNANIDTVCYGIPITYTVAPTGYLLYQFFVNGVSVQSSTGRTFVASGLNPGDSVSAYAFDGLCYSSSATRHPVIKPIPQAPVLSSSIANDTICGGDTITFTALPAGSGIYSFYNGGTTNQSTNLNTWTTTQLGQGNLVYVILTQNGCSGGWSNSIVTFVKPTPLLTTVTGQAVCDGQPATIQASPGGLYFEFILNGQTLQAGLTPTHTTDTLHSGDLLIVRGRLNGCAAVDDTIPIYNNPPQPAITVSGNVLSTTSPSYGFVWYLNSVDVAAGNIQTYTATQSGTYVVEVSNQYGCSTQSEPVVVQVSDLQEAGSRDEVKIVYTYGHSFNLSVSKKLIGTTLELYDVTGKQIFSTRLLNEKINIDCSQFPNGIYFLKVGAAVRKIVMQ